MSSLTKGTVKVDIRRDTATNFASANPTLKAGEPAFETDTKKLKVGDGSTVWSGLAYITDVSLPLAGGAMTGNLTITSSAVDLPMIELTNTHAGATAGKIRFNKDTASGDNNDVMGTIEFFGTDAGEATHEKLAYIDSYVVDATADGEQGGLRFYVAENDATLTLGLSLVGQAADGEVDVTIGAGAASMTTIAGNLDIDGNTITSVGALEIDPGGQLSVTGQDMSVDSTKKVIFGNAGEYIVGDGTDLDIISSNALTLTTGAGDIIFDSYGQDFRFLNQTDTNDYFNIRVTKNSGETILSTISEHDDGHINIEPQGHVEFDGCAVGFDKVVEAFNDNSPITGPYDTTNVDFRAGNKQELTLTNNIAGSGEDLKLTFPATSGNFLLVLVQDGTGSRTIAADAWVAHASDLTVCDNTLGADGTDGEVRWAGGTAPTLSTGANAIDVISIYWDADNQTALAMASLGFAT